MSKSLQERIKDLADYRPNITYKDGTFILKIVFSEHWQIIEPKDTKVVAYSKDDKIPNMYWYASTIEDSDKLFDLIEETIEVNKEFEKKASLYKEKVKELQELFLGDISYDKLKSIQFVIPEKTVQQKKTQKNTKKTKTVKMDVPVETDAVNSKSYDMENTRVTALVTEASTSADQNYVGDIDTIIEQSLGK